MITVRNPQGLPVPATYRHGIEVSGHVRTLYIAGQVGQRPDGSIPAGIEAQTRAVYANVKAVLDSAGMSFSDVVKTTVFLVHPADRETFAAVRAQVTGGALNASTLVFVAGLALPQLRVEVDAIAVEGV